ncbi:unnamed protein product [Amaranthus hypochondriacus]
MNKYNKDVLLLDHYQQSESQNHNVTLKFKQVLRKMVSTIFNANDVTCSFIGKEDLTNNEFKLWCSTHLSWNQKLPIYVGFMFTRFYGKEMQDIDLSSFLTILGIFCSV